MYIVVDMKTRKYDMVTRQHAKTATRDAILTAAIDTFMAQRSLAITLPAVADRADVTVKTVLRHFGSRDALIDAAWAHAYDDVMAERTPPLGRPGSRTARPRLPLRAARRDGPRALADETDPRAAPVTSPGRLAHRGWVEEALRAALPAQSEEHSRLVDVLVVATDVYAWKLLRLDR